MFAPRAMFADVETEVMEQRSKLFEERTALDKQREGFETVQQDWDTEVHNSKRAIDASWEVVEEHAAKSLPLLLSIDAVM